MRRVPDIPEADRELQNAIRNRLSWNPTVDETEITVDVKAGVATLQGAVDDWTEFRAARQCALRAGVTSVITDLNIKSGYGSD